MKKKVVAFGRGKYYQFKKKVIEEKYDLIGYLDNSINEDCKIESNILNPIHWRVFPDDALILLMAKDWYAMYCQLCDYGVPEERIVIGITEEPFFDEFEYFLYRNHVKVKPFKNKGILVKYNDEENVVNTMEEFHIIIRKMYRSEYKLIEMISEMPIQPISRSYGSERGKSIDRVYIDDFIQRNDDKIHGVCLEVGDDRYIKRFGKNVEQTIILHVNGSGENAIKGDFETGEGLIDNSLDCIICTQVLQAIYDIESSVLNIYKALKPGGTVLITVSGAGGTPVSLSDYHNWGVYWRFTDISLKKVLERVFGPKAVDVEAFGNVKTQIAFQYGMCAEDLKDEDFWVYDEKYPMIIAAAATKPFN